MKKLLLLTILIFACGTQTQIVENIDSLKQEIYYVITWDKSPSTDVERYRIYHGQKLDTCVISVNDTSIQIPLERITNRFYFLVSAIDSAGNESIKVMAEEKDDSENR